TLFNRMSIIVTSYILIYFFFQAEDGIRDRTVTGVQTCALPISDTISASRPGARRETLETYIKRLEKLEEIANSFDGVKKAYALRSEERRVGKECRSGWSRELLKEKVRRMVWVDSMQGSV